MPDPKPKPRRRWLRRLLGAAFVALLAAALGALLAIRNLEWLAKWSVHQLFPGVTVEVGSLRLVSSSRLEVRKLVLKSSKTREPLLALENGTAVFNFGNVWRLHLNELVLSRPDLVISPDLGDALGIKPSAATSPGRSSGGLGWGIGRLLIDNGRLRVTRFGERSPTVTLRASADLRDFGVGGEVGKIEHAARLDQISATDASGVPFLKISNADIRFTTDELFAGDHVRAVRIGKGNLTVTPELLAFSGPGQKASPTAPKGQEPRGWTAGSLQLDGVDVAITDAPGQIGRVAFHIAAELRDLGAAGSPQADAEQKVAIAGIQISTDAAPKISLLRADEAALRFTVAGIQRGKIDEVVLKNPVVDLSPKSLRADPAPAKAKSPAPAGASPAAGWLIGRARCDYGTLRLRELDKGIFNFSTKLTFDFRNLGTLDGAGGNNQEVTLWETLAEDGNARPFFAIDAARVRFTVDGLLRGQRVESVKVTGGRLVIGTAFQKLVAADAPPSSQPVPPQAAVAAKPGGWSIGTLDISGVRMRLEDKREGVPDIRMTLNTSLRDVSTSGVSSELFDQVQIVELANIDLNSPLNRSAKIFTLRSIFVRFTLRDLANNHLREVTIRNPIIYLSRDLFVYMERAGAAPAKTTRAASVPAATGPAWSADKVQVKSGRLVIGSGGRRDVGVPIEFETTLENVALDNLATLKVQAALRVPKQDYENADYQISVQDIEGDMHFAYPPEKGEKNLVQKLNIRKVRWRQLESQKSWVAVTFDAKGINGLFGGEAYDGYVNGGFSFNFLDESPWQGWVSGTSVDTASLTDVLAPQNFRLTGPLDFSVQVDALRKSIERLVGTLHMTSPGRMHIGKLDDLLANIPADWPAIKQSSTRIALETLREFDYTQADGDFWFVESQGILALRLTGPLGSRNFEVVLHDGEDTPNPWQQGTLGKR